MDNLCAFWRPDIRRLEEYIWRSELNTAKKFVYLSAKPGFREVALEPN